MDFNIKEAFTKDNLKKFFSSRNFWKPFIGIVIGGLAGYLYYHFIGCSTGTCPISKNPYISSVWGGLMGLFVMTNPCSRNKC